MKKYTLIFFAFFASNSVLASIENTIYPVINDFNVKLGIFAGFESGTNNQNKRNTDEKNSKNSPVI